jgi:hypothetical protein
MLLILLLLELLTYGYYKFWVKDNLSRQLRMKALVDILTGS